MSISADQKASLDDEAVENFRKYLQIPSVQPNIDYEPCVEFLQSQAKSLNLPIKVTSIVDKKPIVIITWEGIKPQLPSILLNSHMDVVPVFEDKWSHKPFSAYMDEKGDIFARGAQDMKCVGIQYLEAVRRLKVQGIRLKRTLHISFVPDEEIGGVDGMKKFVNTDEFKKLNVGFALDEGLASPDDSFALFYGERFIWHAIIHCPGTPGHGSLLLENTAGEKVSGILKKFFDFRQEQVEKLRDNPHLTIGDVTTVNLTKMSGGVQANVVPPELTITIDLRMPPTTDYDQWEATILKWCKEEGGDDVWIEWEQKEPSVVSTKLDESNKFWIAFKQATDDLGLKMKPQIFPGGTDCRFIRSVGIPALGFSPMYNTPILLHDHDEYLNKTVFLKGIDIFCTIIKKVADLE